MLNNNCKISKIVEYMTNKLSVVHMLFVLMLISLSSNFAQENVILFPSNLLVQPFTANTLKPKLGFEFKNNKNELSLNVGSSMDILHYQIDDKSKLSIGADMFTYTLLRSQSDFHFPVDAVDYLFGFNFGFSRDNYGARLRISHISAHFVDGHYNKDAEEWRDGRNPEVYSREFFEFIPFYRINEFRVYAGLTYIYSIDPTNIGTDQYQFGFEYFAKELISSYLTPYIAYDFRLINIYGYTGNNSLEAGLKYGDSDGRGISIYLRYFAGYNIYGEYFNLKEKFTSFGFNLDL
jgi:Protein of unknown function (DUF1207)